MQATPAARIESRLLGLAAVFMGLYALALTLSPSARAPSWQAPLRWEHWAGVLLWGVMVLLTHVQANRWLPERDPYLLPAGVLLGGWGMLTIWRLLPSFGLRQMLWLVAGLILVIIGQRLPSHLSYLRQYKYVWLFSGLGLTALTLLFGTNPSGGDFPHLWLGCCGVYLQPSEPLKLLLIIYLAAYFSSSRRGGWFLPASSLPLQGLLSILAPTLVMTGLALILLVVQRDLGTASIFLFIYAAIVYVASGQKRILAAGTAGILIAGVAGYFLFDVVRLRVEAWVNPWLDPSGRSYQIVQSLLAIANGGLLGRGPGLGSPGLVPVPHSDFIFASISEETGLVGAIGLLLLVGLMACRGIVIALNAPDNFRRYLAAGLAAHLAGQSILIIGGNLRLFPLTGVTLPFVSYGGSSLVTAFLSLLLLLQVSNRSGDRPAPLPVPQPYLNLGGLLFLGLAAAGLTAGWWAIYRGPLLVTRTDNARRAITERLIHRGSILDKNNEALSISQGESGSFIRQVVYPPLSNILGYSNPVYGQSGLEESLDLYLRGQEGIPGLTVWYNHILYGQPPPGLDVRLTLDMNIQRQADHLLGETRSALVLLNAKTGEILAMASHPGFDANTLEASWDSLVTDSASPLLNRATLGLYPPGAVLAPALIASSSEFSKTANAPLQYALDGQTIDCALASPEMSLEGALRNGCPGRVAALGEQLGAAQVQKILEQLGLFTSPVIGLPAGSAAQPKTLLEPGAAALGLDIGVTPLQMALVAASISNGGTRPALQLAAAVHTPQAGWVNLESGSKPVEVFTEDKAQFTSGVFSASEVGFWQITAVTPAGGESGGWVTWYVGGSLASRGSIPLAIAVLLEQKDPLRAIEIGQEVLKAAELP